MPTQTRVAKAAIILMVAMILSRVLGYVRDMVILAQFGQNFLTDAYNAAFTIPDLLYYLVVGGALNAAFIPVFSSYIAREEEQEGWHVASIVLNLILIIMLSGIILIMIFTPQLVELMVPGFIAESKLLTVAMTRIMLVQAFLMALTGVTTGILNSYQKFFPTALGSVLYNVGIIIVGSLLSRYFGITAFAVGVAVGAAAQFLVVFNAVRKLGAQYKPIIDLHHPGVRKIIGLIIPVLIGHSIHQINLIVNQNLVSNLAEGLLSALRNAQRITQLPIGVFAISIAMASFPTMSRHFARNERDEFLDTMSLGLRTIFFVSLPSALGIMAIRTPIIRLLFERGNYTAQDTEATAYALFFYCLGLLAYASLQHLTRVFYAIQDTRTPVITGMLTVVVNFLLNIWLIKVLGHGGSALAYSLAGTFNILLMLYILKWKLKRIGGKKILLSLIKTLAISLVMGIVVYYTSQLISLVIEPVDKLAQLIQVVGSVGVGVVVYTVLSLALKMEEAEMVKSLLKKRLRR
ncbi:MAG: murein biosynthesis integral membrane protein MurJ [Peptococcia bacterium]